MSIIVRATGLVMILLILARIGWLPQTTTTVEAFIFWKAHTTACEMDICDGFDTNSGRNVACCFLFSKCCGYKDLDEAEAIRANISAANAS